MQHTNLEIWPDLSLEDAETLLRINGYTDVTEQYKAHNKRYGLITTALRVYRDPIHGLHYCFGEDEIIEMAFDLPEGI